MSPRPLQPGLPVSDVRALLDRLPARALLVLDEAYRLYADAADVPDGVAELRRNPRVLVLRTFSKTYGLAGLRVGYLLADAAIIDVLARVRDVFAVNAMAQAAAVAALADEDHLARTLDTNRQGRVLLSAACAERGLDCPSSEANFVWLDTGTAADAVWDRLLEHGVVTRNGAMWAAPRHLRVTVGISAQVERFVAALDESLAG